ncbi:MAG: class II aldolase/adducin family protein [Acidobacteriia bacterium]|nr:class II aldolase/adducin family protein [Terriglobia bacterium]
MGLGNETCIRQEVCRIGKLLHERGYVAATDGNISVRLSQNLVLCTPTSMSKGMMQPEDLVMVDMDGHQKDGARHPSTELGMHLLFYCMRPEIRAVVHAHPPTATGFAAAGISLEEPLVAEVVTAFGKIPLARYGMPGTQELANSLRPMVPKHDAILMEHHGVVTCGHDLLKAYMNMESVEHCAKIALVARQLGPTHPIPVEEVRKLMEARRTYEANKAPVSVEWD